MEKEEFVKQQAEAFWSYLNKKGSQSFEVWAESKDFIKDDEQAIKNLVRRMFSHLNYSLRMMLFDKFFSTRTVWRCNHDEQVSSR